MLLDLVFLFIGIAVGLAIRHEMYMHRVENAYEQLDEKIKKDLIYYKNLSDSLKEDMKALKFRIYGENK
jgi:hypothetical protein